LFYLSKIGNTYYFRLRIPKDVQTYFPTKELRRSLGTSKYKLAKCESACNNDPPREVIGIQN